ncbi:site-specific integrase [Peribacillus loiseleuriae]|uniref:Integrase n=1 Tax=Peribacillus loiseleuriae TaxID=1679170 RepID=A0A0K9G3Q0_9BACI|nr:site-specific integrase [Peribacillus loiseleuriae]KMY41465.1 integrase [Peribacillus loiseleuriae]
MKEKNVQPLRTAKEIEDMKWALRRYGSERDYFLFVFGINTGLRVSDIVPLTVGDVRGKAHVVIREKKTNKTKRFMLPVKLREEIEDYTAHMSDEEYLFSSRKGNGPITPTQAYRALVKAGDVLGRGDIGTHTMRKTFGYAYYRRTKDLAFLQNIFNHSAPSITKRYIGITQDEIDETLKDFSL